MPVSVECPECGARNRFPDHLDGKSGRCKTCRERIPVRQSRKRSGKKRKKQSSNTALIAGVVIGLLLLIGVGVAFMLNSGEEPEQGQLADNDNGDQSDSFQNSTPDVQSEKAEHNVPDSSNASSTSSMKDDSTESVASTTPPVTESSGSQGGFSKPATTESEPDLLTFSRSTNWSIKADALESSIQFEPGKEVRVNIPKDSLRGSGIVFPTTASPFVAVRTGSSSKTKYEIFDVTSGRKSGETPAGNSSALAALAPDGTYLALCTSVAKEIEVFDIQGKKSLGMLQLSDEERFQIGSIAIWNDRLVALSTIQRGFKVWELPSGKLLQYVTADDKFNPDYGHCFSPNGKYLAVDGEFLEKRVDIYEVLTGKVVGSISPAGKVRVNELESLGFSLDGKQLCITYGVDIYSQPSRKYSRVIVWDLEPGTVAADFEIEPKLKDQLDPAYKSHTLQPIPGGNRWLAYSRGIIDAGVEQIVYSFDKHDGVDLVPSRKVMGPNWLLSVILEDGEPQLEQTKFTEESLLAGAASAAAGGIASDAKMPPLTPTDLNRASIATPVQQWTAEADQLETGIFNGPIKVNSKCILRDIAISRGSQPIVAIRAGIDEDLSDPKITGYEQAREIYASRGLVLEKPQPLAKESEIIAYDGTGSEIAKLTVPFSGQLQAISPDGKLALLEEHRTNGRLDAFAVENDGKHLVGWRPFGSEGDKNHRELKRVDFVDANHVATLNENYKLVVWKLPSLEPAWKYEEAVNFAVSPGGKHLCVIQGGILGAKGIAVFNSQTGEGLGKVDFEGKITALAYHPSGEFLAVATDSKANKTVRIIDMNSGATIEEIPVPVLTTTLAWTGTDNLLLNGTQLLNRPLQAIVWSYTSKEIALPQNQINDQFTFAAIFGERAVVHSVEVPDSSIAANISQDRLAKLAILKPGDVVSLNVQVPSGATALPLEADVVNALTQSLETAETKVAQTSAISLDVKITPKSEGTVVLSKIGDRSVSETVTRKFILIDFSYQKDGKSIWSSTRQVGNLDRMLVRLKAGQSAQAAIDELMLENANSLFKSMKLPRYIFKESASQGLGSSPLIK
ncbi:hypothetical protein N8553_01535 [bacterium]|nr:hypothetical protein [bacterium]